MTCDELSGDYDAWALGVCGEPERSEIAEHLGRKCAACSAGVSKALGTVAALSGGVKMMDPPKHLRRRVIGMVSPTPKRSWAAIGIPWGIAAMLAMALATVALTARRGMGDTSRLQQALSILNDPTTKDVTFGHQEQPSRGRVFVSAARGVVLIAGSLPRLNPDRTFELWVIPAGGKPIPAGTFRGEADATAVYIRPGPVENAAVVAVTVEAEGGSPQPTTTPIIVAKLGTS